MWYNEGIRIGEVIMSAVTITGDNFEAEVLQAAVPVLLDFWASWCGPCRAVGPLLEELAAENEGRIKVGKVNVDEEASLAEKHEVASIPTLILYKDGKPDRRLVGAVPKQKLQDYFF
jgi:thioredoxin 1